MFSRGGAGKPSEWTWDVRHTSKTGCSVELWGKGYLVPEDSVWPGMARVASEGSRAASLAVDRACLRFLESKVGCTDGVKIRRFQNAYLRI